MFEIYNGISPCKSIDKNKGQHLRKDSKINLCYTLNFLQNDESMNDIKKTQFSNSRKDFFENDFSNIEITDDISPIKVKQQQTTSFSNLDIESLYFQLDEQTQKFDSQKLKEIKQRFGIPITEKYTSNQQDSINNKNLNPKFNFQFVDQTQFDEKQQNFSDDKENKVKNQNNNKIEQKVDTNFKENHIKQQKINNNLINQLEQNKRITRQSFKILKNLQNDDDDDDDKQLNLQNDKKEKKKSFSFNHLKEKQDQQIQETNTNKKAKNDNKIIKPKRQIRQNNIQDKIIVHYKNKQLEIKELFATINKNLNNLNSSFCHVNLSQDIIKIPEKEGFEFFTYESILAEFQEQQKVQSQQRQTRVRKGLQTKLDALKDKPVYFNGMVIGLYRVQPEYLQQYTQKYTQIQLNALAPVNKQKKNKKNETLKEKFQYNILIEDSNTISSTIIVYPQSQKPSKQNIEGQMEIYIKKCENKKIVITQDSISNPNLSKDKKVIIQIGQTFSIQNFSHSQIAEFHCIIIKS